TVQIQITVNGTNDAPVAGADVTATIDEGATGISGTLTSTDVDDNSTATFAVTPGSTAPAGFTLHPDGSYSFDPTDATYEYLNVGDSEILTIPVTVTDDNGGTDTVQIQITVNGTNNAPVAGADVTRSVDEGAATIDGVLTATDVDHPETATFSITTGSTAPSGFMLDTDGTYSFNPTDVAYDHLNVGDTVVLTVPVTVTDEGGGADAMQIQITVNGTNDAPVAGVDVSTTVDEGAGMVSGNLASSDVDDGSTAAFTVTPGSTAPAGFTLHAGGSYSFDPTDATYDHLNVGDSEILTIPVTVTDDNGGTDTVQIQITINGTNDVPVAGIDVTTIVDEGAALINGALTSTDSDDGATATFVVTPGATVPAGFTLNPDGTYSFDPTDATYDHLNVGDSTILTIPVTVTDDQGGIDTVQIQITVNGTNDVPVAGADVTTSVDEGAGMISGNLTSSDVDDDATAAYTTTAVIDGFTLHADGSYSFDPADAAYEHLNVGDSVILTVPVTVTDDQGATDTVQIQITVNGTNDAPVAGADVTTIVDEGAALINGALTSTDSDDGATATFAVTSGSTVPAGFTLNPDGTYSFDPNNAAYDHLNVGDSTILTIPVTVTDDQGGIDTVQIQITVNGTNDAPVAGADVTTSVDEGAGMISGNLTSSDVDDDATAAYTTTATIDGFTLHADGSYSFDPTDAAYEHLNVGDSVILTVPVTVTDDQGATDTVQIQITVNGTNDAPVAGADVTTTIDEGATGISGTLTSTDVDNGSTATFTVTPGSTAPAGFTLHADGSYSFDPTDATYDHLNVGDSVILTVPVTVTDDQGGTDTVQIQIMVNGTNDAPIAGADVTTTVAEGDAAINGTLTSTDLDDGATAAYTTTATIDGFTLHADGSYSFDPTDAAYDHLNVGDSTILTIPVTVTDDNGATDTVQIQITVNGTNDAPVAVADVITSVDEGAAGISGTLTSTDVDDDSTATFAVTPGSTAPAGFTLHADGQYTFDPTDATYDHLNVGDSVILTVPVTVTDDQGGTDTVQIQITVNGTNDAPVAGADVTTSVDEGAGMVSGNLTSSDVDDDATAAYTTTATIDGFTLHADGSYSFDPTDAAYDHLNVGDSTILTIPVTVTDDQGGTDTVQIQITVNGTNDAPVAVADVTATVDEGDATISGTLTATDVDDGSTAIFTVTPGSTAPAGFTLHPDGSYSFDPTDATYEYLNVGDSEILTIPVTVT
ncbi:VCBS domain-containing protein, partial [Desulforhopalus vacuolatus]|uniref:beta strand repeat-containing protein n=1 Tax=Desulforhopalus vacuolatus TaxID=40414 RepID=UPI0019628F62